MGDTMDELRALAMRADAHRTETGIPRVAMVRGKIPEHQLAGMYEPMVNFVLQGQKSIVIGSRVLHFGPASYFVISIDVPATGTVQQGSGGRPYLAVNLTISPRLVSALLTDAEPAESRTAAGFSVCPITPS